MARTGAICDILRELQAWRNYRPMTDEEIEDKATVWDYTLKDIPLSELQRRNAGALVEEMKSQNLFTGGDMLKLWRARQGRHDELAREAEVFAATEEANVKAVKSMSMGPGMARFMSTARSLGYTGDDP